MTIRNNIAALDRALAWIRGNNPQPDATHRTAIARLEVQRRHLERATAVTARMPAVTGGPREVPTERCAR